MMNGITDDPYMGMNSPLDLRRWFIWLIVLEDGYWF